MKRVIIFFLLFAPLQLMAQREVYSLSHSWNFSYLWQSAAQSDASEPKINIPHTWNLDALSGQANYYRGSVDYAKEFTAPEYWQQNKQIYLRFEGVNSRCEVYLNGTRIGEHKGGYTAFGFDITPHLNYAKSNRLWVRVSNSVEENVMPLAGDFNTYGGIYRDVEIIVTPRVHFSHTEYATSGIKVHQHDANDQMAKLGVEYEIAGSVGSVATVALKIKNGSGVVVDSTRKRVTIGMEQMKNEEWRVTIPNPRLWNGTIDPHLYSVEAVVTSQEAPAVGSNSKKIAQSDSLTQHFGIRYFEVNENNQFLLNGQPYHLRGVNRQEDVALLGNAIYVEQQERDLELMENMGVNAVRLAYYPQNQDFMELCDRAGIIVWADIPFTGPSASRLMGFNNTDEFKENGISQLTELIEQNYNRPSIMFWGLFSGISLRNGNPLSYVKELNSVAKELDPSRLTVAASNQDGDINFVTDLIGFNQYMGWLSGMPSDITSWGEAVREEFPKLKVALSEYGAGASPYQHQSNPTKPVVQSYWHPEEWQSKVHEEYLRAIEPQKYFWGCFVNSMFDWGVASLRQGTRPGVNDLGLVTFDRATTKDAYWLYKANWNKDDNFVYITSRRHKVRYNLVQDIKLYTNADEAVISINGSESQAVANDGYGTIVFKDCELKYGHNTIEAFSPTGDYDMITFEVRPQELEKRREELVNTVL